MTSNQKADWILAIIEEIEYLISKNTFTVVTRPKEPVHGSCYVFKIKYAMQPRHLIQNKTPSFVVERFKVRCQWVCQGFRAKRGYDFFDSYTSMQS